ncbi:hypothetical protein DEV91_12910 [Phyllobacterium brassicacearum]|nr:hypothetical protein DEV91_12910 [Phyllobacterium brassicacearum]
MTSEVTPLLDRAPNARDYVLTAFGPLLFEMFALRGRNRDWLAFFLGLTIELSFFQAKGIGIIAPPHTAEC